MLIASANAKINVTLIIGSVYDLLPPLFSIDSAVYQIKKNKVVLLSKEFTKYVNGILL